MEGVPVGTDDSGSGPVTRRGSRGDAPPVDDTEDPPASTGHEEGSLVPPPSPVPVPLVPVPEVSVSLLPVTPGAGLRGPAGPNPGGSGPSWSKISINSSSGPG